jgi:APA family basic amino acid/polyamine antiporter
LFRRSVGLSVTGPWDFWSLKALTVAVILALAAVNIRGVLWGGGLQVAITLVKVGSLVGLALLPFVVLAVGNRPGTVPPAWSNVTPIWPADWWAVSPAALTTAMLSIWWAYHGWMNIAPVAGEVRDPNRNLPISLLLGVMTVVVLYLGCNLSFYLMLPGAKMAALGSTPVATAAAVRMLGPVGGLVSSAMVMCSVFGSLNGNLIVGPRVLFALGCDGMAPRWLHQVHPRWRTPYLAITLLAAWAVLLVIGEAILGSIFPIARMKSPFNRLTDFAMFGALIFDVMAVIAIFRLRKIMPGVPRPYRCPGYPYLPAIYVLAPIFVLVNMMFSHQIESFAGLTLIALGAMVYFALGLQRSGGKIE